MGRTIYFTAPVALDITYMLPYCVAQIMTSVMKKSISLKTPFFLERVNFLTLVFPLLAQLPCPVVLSCHILCKPTRQVCLHFYQSRGRPAPFYTLLKTFRWLSNMVWLYNIRQTFWFMLLLSRALLVRHKQKNKDLRKVVMLYLIRA